jgi:hypothetical protein
MTDDQCVVCSRYITANRSRIRYLVIEESIRTGTVGGKIKKDLCLLHLHIGYSARSHTVGEAGETLDTTEAREVRHQPSLPTLSDFGARHRSHHEYNVRRLRRQKLRRKNRKVFRP